MERNNLTATKAICKAVCNTCYVDKDVLLELLAKQGIDPEAAVDDDQYVELVKIAIKIVVGWVETSRSEGGISTSVSPERVKNSILMWCNDYFLDADELLPNSITIEDGSNMW